MSVSVCVCVGGGGYVSLSDVCLCLCRCVDCDIMPLTSGAAQSGWLMALDPQNPQGDMG